MKRLLLSLIWILTAVGRTVCSALAHTWQMMSGLPVDAYHPELHYMRGPGPKWREKHMQGRGTGRL
jgi:hypothetical protein